MARRSIKTHKFLWKSTRSGRVGIWKTSKGEKVPTEEGTTFVNPYRLGGPSIPGPTKITPFGGITGPKGEVTRGYLEKKAGEQPIYRELLRGTPQSEAKTQQALRKEEVRLLDSEMAQRRSNAAAQIRAITNIDGQSIMAAFASAKPGESANSILANMGIKLNATGIAKVEKIYSDLVTAEKAWSKRRAEYTPGGSLLPAPAAETDPLHLFEVDFDKPLTFR